MSGDGPEALLVEATEAPAGICTVSRGHVTRHATRACRVTLAELTVPTLGQLAFDAAARYRQFTGAAVRIARRQPRTDDWLYRFVRAGIGVFLSSDDRTIALARPRPRPRRRADPPSRDTDW
ncbi:hypothetical protein [Streptomyces sp. TLI_105]|uniref:hypothetical protein n=1 Tax=Streptomyces sp. TLI_105 TaxID=1881019 RepID=UPI000899DD7F|nr:hypothetical protein [Streptomyces sp. TLI_105]SEB57237.1 hypothetical protein SAMN05428939_0027 [Streptomyces sp. TLI_105]SEE26552.1 hypothetical protein SAMN05428939_7933 [Streptomyces sp. TLI_105]